MVIKQFPAGCKSATDVLKSKGFRDFLKNHKQRADDAIDTVDKILAQGIPVGDLTMIIGQTTPKPSPLEIYLKQFEV